MSRCWMAALLAAALGAGETPFADVAGSSGVAALLAEQYRAQPKWWLSGTHLVDLDGDGRLDLFLDGHGGGAVAALGDGKGGFARAPGSWPGSEIHTAYDLDEDGRLDLAMTHHDGGGRWWLNRSKPGELAFVATDQTAGGQQARQQALIDLDGDGRVDWLRHNQVDRGDGAGRFQTSWRSLALPGNPRLDSIAVIAADLDGDGDSDLAFEWGRYQDVDGRSRLFRNDGAAGFADISAASGLDAPGLSIKGVGDVDHDGDLDLIVLEQRLLSGIWLNDGSARFMRKDGAIRGVTRKAAYASWGIAVCTDLDDDGIADLVVDGRHFLSVLRGKGDGTFDRVNDAWGIRDLAAAAVDEGLCFGDIDGDGDLDLIGFTAIDTPKRLAVYRNDLPRRRHLAVRPVGRPGNRGAAGAKIRVYEAGTQRLLWYEQVCTYCRQACPSWYAHSQTERRFGLGTRTVVDVSVEFHPTRTLVWKRGVPADTTIVVREDGG